jgi:hypothetical protein
VPVTAAWGTSGPNAPLPASQVAGRSAHTRGVSSAPVRVSATGTGARSPPPSTPTSTSRSVSPLIATSTWICTAASEPSA